MAETEKDKKDGDKDKKKKTPFSVRFALFMLVVIGALFLPSTILFAVCMVPTLVASIIDDMRPRTAWLTVGAMNLAGTIPTWFKLWDTGHTITNAFHMAIDPATLIAAYGGAAVGWFIYYNVTPMVAGLVHKKSEYRLHDISKRQKALIKKWGDKVTAG